MSMNIENKVALVTGANCGIGKSIVETFLKRGAAKVYAAVRNAESANSLVVAHSGKVVPIQVDLRKPETIAAAAKQATDVNIVVNNAGILCNSSPLSEDAYTVLLQEMDINVGGLIRIAQTLSEASAISHDVYVSVIRHGNVQSGEELKVSSVATILLGIIFEKQNVAYMAGLAFAIVASVNFPILFLSMYWQKLTTRGAFVGG